MQLKSILEALIFAADKPISARQLKELTGAKTAEVSETLEHMVHEFQNSGIQLVELSGGYQFRTHPDCGTYVKRMLAGRPARLTRPMVETLAIVAYRQPITRPEIEEIRGVDCGGTMRVLMERNLVRVLGKKEEPGRPVLFGTTKHFLEFFNLKDLRELPTLKEFTELSEEHQAQFDDMYGGRSAEDKVSVPVSDEVGTAEPESLADGVPPDGGAEVAQAAEAFDAATPGDAFAATPGAEEQLSEHAVPECAPANDGASEDPAFAGAQAAVDSAVSAVEELAAASTGEPAPLQPAPPPARPAWSEEEDDEALDALDRAIARAEEVLATSQPPRAAQTPAASGTAPDASDPPAVD